MLHVYMWNEFMFVLAIYIYIYTYIICKVNSLDMQSQIDVLMYFTSMQIKKLKTQLVAAGITANVVLILKLLQQQTKQTIMTNI